MSAAPAPPVRGMAVRELHRDFDPELLARLYGELLEPTFSSEELEPVEPLAARLSTREAPDSLAAVALGPGDELLGGLVADLDREIGVLLLSYLAVRPDAREQGIGAYLLGNVAARWYATEGVLLAVGEVHDPRHWPGEADRAVDRLRLFERLGARLLSVPFIQPRLHEDRERVPGFLLLAFHVDARVSGGGGGVSSSLVGRFVRRYFETAEGPGPADAELTSLLARIERDEFIELLDPSEYDRVAPPERR